MSAPGLATIDFETTGLFPEDDDRAIKVAIVQVEPAGAITGRWNTHLNPLHDLCRQDLRRISAAKISRTQP